jgi:hypothetical protein
MLLERRRDDSSREIGPKTAVTQILYRGQEDNRQTEFVV